MLTLKRSIANIFLDLNAKDAWTFYNTTSDNIQFQILDICSITMS